jgi:hypothetical protein
MPTTRTFPLHENLLGGVNTTAPAHLIGVDSWRTQHNCRLTPTIQQLPRKYVSDTVGSEDIRWLGVIPSLTPGYGQGLILTPTKLLDMNAVQLNNTAFTSDTTFRRWSTALYDGRLFFINELNQLQVFQNGVLSAVTNAPAGRYITFWYDHAFVGFPINYAHCSTNGVAWSHLYDFTVWSPDATNEADFYEFVEWQQTDHPFIGVTGQGKLRGMLWIYTPTAIIPMSYVGMPKIVQVLDEGIITRTGNSFPWTMVPLDNVHFYYEAQEAMFFAFTGQQIEAVGEPVRRFMLDNLNEDIELAQKMYGYIDPDNREIWWPFVSKESSGEFDKAVVFNYRYKKWFTASSENVQCFCSGSKTLDTILSLDVTIAALAGTIGDLGLNETSIGRLYGTDSGELLREETEADADPELAATPYDDPVLESGDFHYGDIRATKECDGMILNTTAPKVGIRVSGRNFLGDAPTFPVDANAEWTPTLPDLMSNFRAVAGRVFRYRFTLKDSKLATFDAFSEGMLVKQAEK